MIWIITFISGALIGSFINCVIHRLETKEGFVKGRSYCPYCKKEIDYRDLVPVLSFLLLRGKCRNCGKKISWQYPLVEIATGVIFTLILFSQQSKEIIGFFGRLEMSYLFLVFCLMIIIFIYDLRHYLIPDEAIFTAIGIVSIWHIGSLLTGIITFSEILSFLLSGIGASGFFLTIFLISKGAWMGFGDVKLALFMGLFLGYPKIIVALFSSFMLGAIIGTIMVLFKKKGIKSEIPFAPFLIFGTIFAFFLGETIFLWYFNFFLMNVFNF